MIKKITKNASRQKRHKRIRQSLVGTPVRPRLNVYRSNRYIYAQLIDDVNGVTLASASSLEEAVDSKDAGNKKGAEVVGKTLAERAKKHDIEKVVFDRAGYKYHGRIKALADAARDAGLQF